MNNKTTKTPGKTKRSWFVRAGIMSSALIATVIGSSQNSYAANDQKYIDLFFAQGYRWCDARKLAKIFEKPPEQAKVIAGQKIAANNLAAVQVAWTEGVAFFNKYGFSCGSGSLKNNSMERYAYNDVSRITKAWKSPKKI